MTDVTQLPPADLPDRALSICVVGAGAIGGAIAAQLASAPPEAGIGAVSVVARGAHLAAIQAQGLRLRTTSAPDIRTFQVTATDDPDSLPAQDVIITALKGHQIPAMADQLARLLAPHGRILSVVNGLPWWYPISDGAGSTRGAEKVDPGGALWSAIGPARAIGTIAFFSAFVEEPGLIHVNNEGYIDLGRLPGQDTRDVLRMADVMEKAGLSIRRTQPFQNALWNKIMGNAALNSVCAVSQAPVHRALADPVLMAFVVSIMQEVQAVGLAEKVDFPTSPEERATAARDKLRIKPSTLQDLEAGRPMEIEPIFGAVLSVAQSHGLDCPNLTLVTAMLRSIDRTRFPDPA